MINKLGFIPIKAEQIIKDINTYGYEAYLVGGCVRDMLLGVKPNDWDICTSATPSNIIDICKKYNYKYHTKGIKYGTINIIDGDEEYEVTTFRTDGVYYDNRRPNEVKFTSNIFEDLKRRDFTINALAFDVNTEKIIGESSWVDDLNKGIIRCVGDPDLRFKEDSLRIIRALRFSIKLEFKIEENTIKSAYKHLNLIDNISKERITDELRKILTCGKPIKHHFMKYGDILGRVIPEMTCCFDFNQNNRYHVHDVYEHILYVVDNCDTNDFVIKLAALLHDIAKPHCYTEDAKGGHFYGHPKVSHQISEDIFKTRIRLTNQERDEALLLILHHDMSVLNTKNSVKKKLKLLGPDTFNKWCILKKADQDDHVYYDNTKNYKINIEEIKSIAENIVNEKECFSLKHLNIDGNILMKELNLKPGKHIGYILDTLLYLVIDNKISNDTEELIAKAKEIVV